MAMKEIAIQPGETRAIKNVAEELKIFEGINHRHLVKLNGVEVHRVSAWEVCSRRHQQMASFPFAGGVIDFHGTVFRGYVREFG